MCLFRFDARYAVLLRCTKIMENTVRYTETVIKAKYTTLDNALYIYIYYIFNRAWFVNLPGNCTFVQSFELIFTLFYLCNKYLEVKIQFLRFTRYLFRQKDYRDIRDIFSTEVR